MTVTVRGLASRLDATLDLLADAVLRPRLESSDLDRERRLALERIRSRDQNPMTVALIAARSVAYGHDDPRGRPTAGYEHTVAELGVTDVRAAHPELFHPSRVRMVFVGDLDADSLKAALESDFGSWTAPTPRPIPVPPALTVGRPGLYLVDRPRAPQTTIFILRPVPAPESGPDRLGRRCVNTLFGGSFTSRLMRNLREQHGYTYHAGSVLRQRGDQHELYAYSSVQADATAAALAELRREFGRLAGGDITTDELAKATNTVRYELVSTGESTDSLAHTLAGLAADGRPLDSVAADLESLETVELGLVNGIARSGQFDWDQLSIVLVGDADGVTRQLEEAGFTAPRAVDSEGRPMQD